jgi:FlaA1/EpsC-like NDP-sugar epimerase
MSKAPPRSGSRDDRRQRQRRPGGQAFADGLVWAIALVAAQTLRYELDVARMSPLWTLTLVLAAVVVQFVVGWSTQLYRARYLQGSFAEVRALVVSVAVTSAAVGLPVLLWGTAGSIPRSTVLIAAPIALVGMAAVRYIRRLRTERPVAAPAGAKRALVYGAGDLGGTLVRRMLRARNSGIHPIGLLDDDPGKSNLVLHGVRVVGRGDALTDVAARTGAEVLVLAIGRANAHLMRRVADDAAAAGLTLLVLPPFEEVRQGRSSPRDLREVAIEDLIGRHPVLTREDEVAEYLTGRRVLVTGAGGSIGGELCRQIARLSPGELIMLDRDETGLQTTQISIHGHGLLDTREVVLADIRDRDALERVFAERRPEVIFHAAALKHLPILEQYPDEAWKTNVLGTLNVVEAALAAGVPTFVNISTDKAANPISVLGRSKRLGEQLVAWAAERSGGRYVSVRFGNVLGSRGSLIPTFTTLIESGGPVTVTHPDVTRYFMTIREACQLVLQAGGIGRPGEVLILDMGEPVRILDIAMRMIEMSGHDVPIVYTGLRSGEKLHEDLLGVGEVDTRPVHPQVSHTVAPSLTPADLDPRSLLDPGDRT